MLEKMKDFEYSKEQIKGIELHKVGLLGSGHLVIDPIEGGSVKITVRHRTAYDRLVSLTQALVRNWSVYLNGPGVRGPRGRGPVGICSGGICLDGCLSSRNMLVRSLARYSLMDVSTDRIGMNENIEQENS